MRTLAMLPLVAVALGTVARSPSDPFRFYAPLQLAQESDRDRLARGGTIARVVPASPGAIAVFSAIAADITGDRLLAWVRDIAALKRSEYVVAIGRFSNPPQLADLAALTLDDGDLRDLRRCVPGQCGLKLTDDEVRTLRRVDEQGRSAPGVVQDAFRRVVLQRAETYVRSGAPSDMRPRFSALLRDSPFLERRLPGIAEALERWPHPLEPGVESFLYWSKERLGHKPVISVTHVLLIRCAGDDVEAVSIGRQVFATHYMDASLSVTAILRDGAGRQRYLTYLNRTDLDVLRGFWGGLVRRIVAHRLQSEAPAALERLRDRLQQGDPPAAANPGS